MPQTPGVMGDLKQPV